MNSVSNPFVSAVRWLLCFPAGIIAYMIITPLLFYIAAKIVPFFLNVANYFYVSKNQALEDMYNQTALAKAETEAGNIVLLIIIVGFLASISAYCYSLIVGLIAPKRTEVLHIAISIILILLLLIATYQSGLEFWYLKLSFMVGTSIGLITSSEFYQEK
jgi:MFS-type transporter involved in bile tolerance (Atg22 family)